MDRINGWQSYATICRLCLQKDGFMFGIFNQNSGNEKSLYKKIVDCTALQIAMDDGLPNVICHRCLYKIDFCLEFRQQCFVSDATLRRINDENEPSILQAPLNFHDHTDDVVMVVDPNVADYNSDIDAEPEVPSENDNSILNKSYGYGFSNISMCRYCDHAFMSKEECNSHETMAHNNETPYSCAACSVNFENRIHYLTHLKNVHKDDKPFKCPQCSRTFARRSDLRKHTIVHTGIKPFTCKVCFKSFSRNTNLSKHMRIHSGHKLFSCKKCHKKFLSKADLGKHSVYHSKVKTKKAQISKKNSQKSSTTQAVNGEDIDAEINNVNNDAGNENHSENMVISIDPFTQDTFQDEDDDQMSTSSRISDHNADYEQIVSTSQQENYYSNDAQENSTQSSPSRPFVCSTCKKSFMRKRELDRHILTHTGMKPFKCTRCDKSFGRKDKLVRHMRIHDVNKQFSCDMCEETFSRKESLTQHQKVYHTSYHNEVF
ncbi:zinc finger protein 28-like [Coccinella septempunctata]|uniref:zinc finger protein 28-like n=1 Tax=Coccinella septempunctata TaxID=41139 RepID=UPI001D087A9D|nr:zinc finger protein 28-like [Coccinella septempunctata]